MATKKKAVLECCCGACVGCCFPVDYSIPQYPNGVVKDIPFEFVAPNCSQLNGTTGFFDPINPTSSPMGVCGPCGGLIGRNQVVISGVRWTPIITCSPTPCSFNICLILECNPDELPIEGLDSCCSRTRLWIGTSDQQVEDNGDRPPNFTAFSCTSWKMVNPIQCTCDPYLGISARFPFTINLDCPTFATGPCAGQPNCCRVACDLTDAELVI